jgi:hypothetical protein
MIKRILFGTKGPDISAEAFQAAWRQTLAGAGQAPPGARPSRVAACFALPDLTGPEPRHDAIGLQWFAATDHLQRFLAWLCTSDGQVDHGVSTVIVADESVMRGADWLEQRWRDGDEKLKHMALAVRASNLTPAEFSTAWRGRAGQIRQVKAAAVTVIPPEARGHAYVQNHPCPRPAREWAYDAVNEVYFDDVPSLRRRIEWFRENLGGQGEADLIRQSWFIAAREEVLA